MLGQVVSGRSGPSSSTQVVGAWLVTSKLGGLFRNSTEAVRPSGLVISALRQTSPHPFIALIYIYHSDRKMATEPPPPPPTGPAATAPVTSTPAASTPPVTDAKPKIPVPDKPLIGHAPRPPPPPLEGWRGVLQYTGLPRGVLTWKPKLPGPKMSVFLALVGGVGYLYYDDRSKAKAIKAEYIAKVQHLAQQPTRGSLDVPRKVLVYGARWPEDDEANRALVYFRKYVKVSAPGRRAAEGGE